MSVVLPHGWRESREKKEKEGKDLLRCRNLALDRPFMKGGKKGPGGEREKEKEKKKKGKRKN